MTLTLTDRGVQAVRRLLMVEPEPGSVLPRPAVDALVQLIGCDRFGGNEADRTGYSIRGFDLSGDDFGIGPQVCDGPLPTGIVHLAASADCSPSDFPDIADTLWSGFATSRGTVVQIYFDRRRSEFDERDVALLTMVEPVVGRLLRPRPRNGAAETLTASERRVLALVANGATNREVADDLYVTVHTVRKHLEHAYRKLGVGNRTAAALLLRPES